MVNFNEFSVDELVSMREELNATIKVKRAGAREAEKASRETRAAEMREALSGLESGVSIAFLYNKNRVEGTFVRASEKSVTAKFTKEDGSEWEGYRKYGDVLEILN
jgi:epoxyqueuosine reductase QueG